MQTILPLLLVAIAVAWLLRIRARRRERRRLRRLEAERRLDRRRAWRAAHPEVSANLRGTTQTAAPPGSVPAQFPESLGVGFPVTSIEVLEFHLRDLAAIETAEIDAVPVRIGSRHVEGLDAAAPAEQVPRGTGIE